MARGVNKVILVGNVGGDPDVRYMPNGNAATTLSIATSESWKDKQTGEKQERTEWHRVICYARLGEIAGQYIRKGSKIYVEGSLRTRKWQDQQGQDKYMTEIIASEMQMLDSKGGPNSSFNEAPPAHARDAQGSSYALEVPTRSQPATESTAQAAFDDLNDDIPF